MAIDFTGVTLPFTASDVLTSTMGLIGVVASLVILGIVVGFAPRLVSFIKSAITSRSKA